MRSIDPTVELVQIQRDAARYQFLRNRNLDAIEGGGVFAGLTPDNVILNGVDLDAAIDAAIEINELTEKQAC